jgi:hypothetical protein
LITLNVHQQESCCKKNYFALLSDGSLRGFVLPASRADLSEFSSEAGLTHNPLFAGNLMWGIAATIVGFVTSEVTW